MRWCASTRRSRHGHEAGARGLTALRSAVCLRRVPRRIFTAVAWLLVALWLPAALHCAAEASGVFGDSECCAGEVAGPESDHQGTPDHCEVIEAGASREDYGDLHVVVASPVVLQILRPPLGLLLLGRQGGIAPAAAEPPELVRLWRVVERVVAFAQAP